MTERSAKRGTRSGSILILAFWVLLFLGWLAVAVGALVSANLNLASHLKTEATGYFAARAAVEHAATAVRRGVTNELQVSDRPLPAVDGSSESESVGYFSLDLEKVTNGVTSAALGYTIESLTNLPEVCYCGVATGWTDAQGAGTNRIDFVIDRDGRKLYWYEH
jgi:hypothetical protein